MLLHYILLQIICNPQLQFIHCYAGQVGSVHDMRVLRLSNFGEMCTNENFTNDSHIIGDAAYQISKYIMVPFKDNGHLGDNEKPVQLSSIFRENDDRTSDRFVEGPF